MGRHKADEDNKTVLEQFKIVFPYHQWDSVAVEAEMSGINFVIVKWREAPV